MATFQKAQVEPSMVTSVLALKKLRQEDLKFIARHLSHKKAGSTCEYCSVVESLPLVRSPVSIKQTKALIMFGIFRDLFFLNVH